MDDAEVDLYGVLGVAGNASAGDIRRAYRRLARQQHPDLNEHPDGARRFAALAHAYEVLRDPARRARYDQARAPSPAPSPRIRRRDGRPVSIRDHGIRRGTLELSPDEAAHVARQPLALRDAHGHTIMLPAGTRHGDQITLLHEGREAILTVRLADRT